MKKKALGIIAVIMFIVGACMMDCPQGTDAQTEALNIVVASFLIADSCIIGGFSLEIE